jgi:hypothetical protein
MFDMPRYDDSNIVLLHDRPWNTEDGTLQALPRRSVCGSSEAAAMGLVPVRDFPELLPDPKDFKEIIADCHARQVFPMYHRRASKLKQKPNQNGLGHCWNYGMTHTTEDCALLEGRPDADVIRAPNSLGWMVNWRNQGYYLDATIKGASERGIAPASMCPEYELNPKRFDPKWQEEALKFRPVEWWDTDRSEGVSGFIQQCLAILMTGRGGYVAHDDWGHALECTGMIWDESVLNNIVWVHFNSHSDGAIELAGRAAIPDEFYGVRATNAP